MKRRLLVLVWAVFTVPTAAQEPAYQEDLRFARELRAKGYKDLAEEYLNRIAKNASPELRDELALEIAKAQLDKAHDEPDTNKRITLYQQARVELRKFVDTHPKHARLNEAKLDVARVSVLQGKAQLSRALADPATLREETPDLVKARGLFTDAGKELEVVATDLKRQLAPLREAVTPEDKKLKFRLERDVLQAEFSIALNIYDIAQSFPKEGKDVAARNERVQEATKRFEKAAAGDDTQNVTWLARVWLGRCKEELGKPKDAREAYDKVRQGGNRLPAAAEAVRLARYFDLLTVLYTPELLPKKDVPKLVEDGARAWIRDYPRFLNTNEGYGVRYLLAELLLERTEKPKQAELEFGRGLIREIEQTENEFTDRARTLKIRLIAKGGGFSKPISDLKSFEDCYIRAQYEIEQLGKAHEELAKAQAELRSAAKDQREAKEKAVKDAEKKRDKVMDDISTALARGLETTEAKKKPTREVNNSRAMLSYFYLERGKYKEAAQVGRAFAENDPRSPQAALAASYALMAYNQILNDRLRAGATLDECKTEKDQLLQWAQYIDSRWSKDPAGDTARDQIARMSLREKKVGEALNVLMRISPAFPEYARVQYQLYELGGQADRDGIKSPDGGKTWTQLGLEALERIPDQTSADASFSFNNHIYMMSRLVLAQEAFRNKNFARTDALLREMTTKLQMQPPLVFSPLGEQDDKVRDYLKNNVTDLKLRALFVHIKSDYDAQKHEAVAKALNQFVKEVKEGKWPELKANMTVGGPLLNIALRSNLLSNNLAQAREVLKVMRDTSEEGAGDKTAETLNVLAGLGKQLMDEVKKKDPKELPKTIAGLTELLNDAIKDQKLNTEVVLALAQVYASMDQHGKASDLLAKVEEPKGNPPPEKEMREYRISRVLYLRELRHLKELEKANKVLEEIMGTPGKRGWGYASTGALKELVLIREAEENYFQSAQQANALAGRLVKNIPPGGNAPEDFFEMSYHAVYGAVKHAQHLNKTKPDAAKYSKALAGAARIIVGLESRYKGLGTDATTKLFRDFLASEPDLNAEYEKAKPKK
jgi:hypothetical protein